jgi:hypothetical protein
MPSCQSRRSELWPMPLRSTKDDVSMYAGIVALISLNKQAKVRDLSGFSSYSCRVCRWEFNG